MVTFLFWNLQRKDLRQPLRRLATRHDIDILILAECNISVAGMLKIFNDEGHEAQYHYATGRVSGKIEIYTRFPGDFQEAVTEEGRYTIRRFHLPGRDEFILAAAHLISPMHSGVYDRNEGARLFADDIRNVEQSLNNDRTIVVGDFNLNPFDEGMVAATALHGVMSKEIAKRNSRVVSKQNYPFFYNPMWRLFGDNNDCPSGTYYYDKSGQVCHFWNMFDQVLIRPSLIDAWNDEDLKILTEDGESSFLTRRGFPDPDQSSDHLPILFRINV